MPGKIVLVSGGFDPVHVGHIRLFAAAAKLGRVFVALNSDAWLIRKKGSAFMTWVERAEILEAIRYINQVHSVDDRDGTVQDTIKRLLPDYFANGGDREHADVFEAAACHENGIKQLFGVGGGKVQSSSALLGRFR